MFRRIPFYLVASLLCVGISGLLLNDIAPLLPGYALHTSPFFAAMIFAGYPVGSIFINLPISVISRRLSLFQLIFASAIFMSIGTTLLVWPPDKWYIILGRVFQGMASTLTWQAILSWSITQSAPENRGRSISLVFSTYTAGQLIGPLFGAEALKIGLATLLIPCLLLIIASLLFYKAPAYPTGKETSLRGSFTSLGKSSILPLSLYGLASLGLAVLSVKAPLLLNAHHLSPRLIALVFSSSAVMLILVYPFIGRTSDKSQKIRGLVTLLIIGSLVTLVVLAFSPPTYLLVPLVFFSIILTDLIYIPANYMASHEFEERHIDQRLSAAFLSIVWSVATLGGSLLAGSTSQIVTFLILSAISASLGIVSYTALSKNKI